MKYRLFVLICVLLLGFACGKKGTPYPKDTLDIPLPENVEFTLDNGGIRIVNKTDHEVLVERTGATFRIGAGNYLLDNSVKESTRYVYRVVARHKRFDAYSAPVSRTVYYTSSVEIKSVSWEVIKNNLCLDITTTPNVDSINILINGKDGQSVGGDCYVLPPLSRVLLVVVPISSSGMQGRAYSANILRDPNSLLPPQNVQVLRRVADGRAQITISWASAARADIYTVSMTEPSGRVTRADIDSTIHTWYTGVQSCVVFELATRRGDEVSESIKVTSCP